MQRLARSVARPSRPCPAIPARTIFLKKTVACELSLRIIGRVSNDGGTDGMRSASLTFDTLPDFVGRSIGISSWIDVPQSRIDAFAECTGDRQWIHVDVERARCESPFGAPVAHGFLTLSLLPIAVYELFAGLGARKSINYGLDRVRFISPVRAGSRVRVNTILLEVEHGPADWVLLRSENKFEIEGEDNLALIAVSLGLFCRT